MTYEWFKGRFGSDLRAFWDFSAGSMYELVNGIAPTVTAPYSPAAKLVAGAGLRRGGNDVRYGDNFNVSQVPQTWFIDVSLAPAPTSQPYVILMSKMAGWGAQGWQLYRANSEAGLTFQITESGSKYAFWTFIGGMTGLKSAGRRLVVVFSWNTGYDAGAVTALVNGIQQTSSVSSAGTPPFNSTTTTTVAPAGYAQPSYYTPATITRACGMINRVVTIAEMREIYEHLVSERPAASRAYSFPAKYPIRTVAENQAEECILQYVPTVKGSSTSVTNYQISPNFASNDRLAQVQMRWQATGGPFPQVSQGGPFGKFAEWRGGTERTFPYIYSLQNSQTLTKLSFSIWHRFVLGAGSRFAMEGSLQPVFDIAPTYVGTQIFAGGNARKTINLPTKWTHYSLVIDGSTIKLYIDGTETSWTTNTWTGFTFPINLQQLFFTRAGATSQGASAYIEEHSRALTAAEVRKKYLEGAKAIVFDGRLPKDGSCPVMAAGVGQGSAIAGTPWYVHSSGGKVVVLEDAPSAGKLGKRWLRQSVTSDTHVSTASGVNPSAYGSWYIRCKPNVVVYLAMPTRPRQDGWYLAALTNYVSLERYGTSTAFRTAANYLTAGVEYEFWVTRTYAGTWTVWVRGGVYAAWTLVSTAGGSGTNPVTDTNVTTSKYANFYMDGSNGYMGDYIHYQGEMTPLEAEQIGLLAPTNWYPLGTWSTAETTQTVQVQLTSSDSTLIIDWGDGTQSWHGGSSLVTINHTYPAGGATHTQKWYLSSKESLYYLRIAGNQLSGDLNNLFACSNLLYLYCFDNMFTTLPRMDALVNLNTLSFANNALVGQIPSVSACQSLGFIQLSNNQLTGDIPDISSLSNLEELSVNDNKLTGAKQFGWPVSCYQCYMYNNELTESGVDQLLLNLLATVNDNSDYVEFMLDGTGNSPPSAAGIAARDACLAIWPDWYITHN